MKTHTKKGELTAYALCCGYKEVTIINNSVEITLTRDNNIYRVLVWGKLLYKVLNECHVYTLSDARKFIAQQKCFYTTFKKIA